MTERVSGGCKCGSVRYEGEPIDAPMFRCHCRDCQQLTGTGHSEMMPLDGATFSVSDTLKVFEMKGGSGQPTYSGFCPDCGSPIMRRSARMNDRVYVHAGSLDDRSNYRAIKSIYPDATPHWDRDAVIDG